MLWPQKPQGMFNEEEMGWDRCIDACKEAYEAHTAGLVPSRLEPPDYETPLNRAFLINKISEWYDIKFLHEKLRFKTISVFDLIADFIIDTKYGTPSRKVFPLDEEAMAEIRDCISHYFDQSDSKDVDRIMNLIGKYGTPSPKVLSSIDIANILIDAERLSGMGIMLDATRADMLATAIHKAQGGIK